MIEIISIFVVVTFWAFFVCSIFVVIGSLNSPLGWLDGFFEGVEGAFYIAVAVGFMAAILRLVWVSHLFIFGGGF